MARVPRIVVRRRTHVATIDPANMEQQRTNFVRTYHSLALYHGILETLVWNWEMLKIQQPKCLRRRDVSVKTTNGILAVVSVMLGTNLKDDLINPYVVFKGTKMVRFLNHLLSTPKSILMMVCATQDANSFNGDIVLDFLKKNVKLTLDQSRDVIHEIRPMEPPCIAIVILD